jgi:Zn-dependent protease with chaperone function
MNGLGLLLFAIAAAGIVAMLVSLAVGLAFARFADAIASLAPRAQVRLCSVAAWMPGFAAVTVELGWMIDQHVLGCTAHHCAHHFAAAPAWIAVGLVASAVVVRMGVTLASLARELALARRLRQQLDAVAERSGDVSLTPFDEPHAFVLGLVKPQPYVSRGLLALDGSCVESVLAHERAHARRGDPLRRVIASLGLAWHLPGIAGRLERALARAQELAADAEAVEQLGDAPQLAESIVRLTRLQIARPAPAIGWQGDLEARVQALLRDSAGRDRLQPAAVLGLALVFGVVAVLAADPLHHAAEAVLVLLAG